MPKQEPLKKLSSAFPKDLNGVPVECYSWHEIKTYTLVASTDSGENLAFSEPVCNFQIDNQGSQNVYIAFDRPATNADWRIQPGEKWGVALQVKCIHAWSSSTPTVSVLGLR